MGGTETVAAFGVIAVGWALVHFLWQGALLHVALLAALRFIPTARIQLRYALALVALLLMAIAPAATLMLTVQQSDVVLDGLVAGAAPEGSGTAPMLPSLTALRAGAADLPREVRLVELPALVGAEAVALRARAVPLLPWVVYTWLAGASLFTLRLLGGARSASRLRTHGLTPAPRWLASATARLADRLGLGHARVMVSARAPVPMVVGALRPVVLVPASVLSGLPPTQLELIIAHELAHIRRWDVLVNYVQCAIEAVLFYHPSVWMVSRLVRAEREHCCDAAAVATCEDPVGYARALSELAMLSRPLNVGAAATGGPLVTRVRRVLGRIESPLAPLGVSVAACVMAVILGAGSAYALQTSDDQVARVVTNPALASRLVGDEIHALLRRAHELPAAERLVLLEALAPVAADEAQARDLFLYAAATLPPSEQAVAVDRLLAQADGSDRDGAASGMVVVGPNEVPNFRSVGFMAAPLLEPGFDLGRARLAGHDGGEFPPGRQFVYIQSLVPPGSGLDRSRLLERIDFERFRGVGFSSPERFHILLVKSATIDYSMPPYSDLDFTLEELLEHPDAVKVEGPWSLWVDAANLVTYRISIINAPLADDAVLSANAASQFACVEDGKVVGTVAGYWPAASDEHLIELFDACLGGVWGAEWDITPYAAGRLAPAFELSDGAGGRLSLADLSGRPFVLVAPAPMAQEPVTVPEGAFITRAVEPAAADRVSQLEALIRETAVDARLVVVALPYAHGGVVMEAGEVAVELRKQLGVHVYEDASGTFMFRYAQFVSRQNPVLLVGGDGLIVDAYVDMPTGEVAFLDIQGPSLSEGLQRLLASTP